MIQSIACVEVEIELLALGRTLDTLRELVLLDLLH